MCGIAGIINCNKNHVNITRIKAMGDSIKHRGPDEEGYWINEENTVALGHRRLAILDLSDAGSQPMHYMDRYTIVFNGEIYNYIEVREKLIKKGYYFVSNSDTEVLVALFDLKAEYCLDDLDGMFSFAIWDNKLERLFCARDRFGEKPFYYVTENNEFLFCSEMKGIWSAGFQKTTNEIMLFNYIYFGNVYNPQDLSETFYNGINSLPHSHFMFVDKNGKIIEQKKYWDIDYKYENRNISFEDAKNEFFNLLYNSVDKRLRSDVSIGSSLSGGLDSSTIVYLINSISGSSELQKTFSARFPGYAKDESYYIDLVLSQINAKGYSCFPDESNILDDLPRIIIHQEEPFASLSIAAQYQVMRLARSENTIVMLDGQGADEFLCGYHGLVDSFFFELKKKSKIEFEDQLNLYKKTHESNSINSIERRLRNMKIKSVLSNKNLNSGIYFRAILANIKNPKALNDLIFTYRNYQYQKKYKSDSLNEMLYEFTFGGSLQELLRYSDRNSMAHSVEVRLPFLDHKLVEFVFSLPARFKVNNGFSKYILRSAIDNKLLDRITWRKDKIGYEPPNKSIIKGTSLNKYLIDEISL